MSDRVVHVCTVHWKSDRWIDPQLSYLTRHLSTPTRTYAVLNGLEGARDEDFDVALDLPGRHADKLNALAQRVATDAARDDILMFLDGDAFPIKPLDGWLDAALAEAPLAAVRRDENGGDRQPHPCFCVTTVGFWQDIAGDWTEGSWVNDDGREVSDVGGRLLGTLEDRGITWKPLLRTNAVDLHPVLFAVYDDVVYHHGAGFRAPRVRATGPTRGPRSTEASGVRRAIRSRLKHRSLQRIRKVSDDVFAQIVADPQFYEQFTG